ncbi:DUF1173 family protein [Mycobacteroides abscessus]|uniref:DUF1173 family protein n=1 Tax=Mycobacteroides abscessus TaxID=36809 RepID=UPI0009A67F05|nr:DUF1173 family protein [Mycobacteroides abscessus]SKO15564.1 Predicted transcriptional regulators containing the CopG/Arc/MetJ DNA-binding domain [Mycobacteroides abscessus subsp. bolletii]SKX37273.1 Predicted transcriptional regulators containing the CopG/Arc/MetJ DNA-binding domain [Mycobacteroides abscessus subsp. bolletii]
MTAAFEVDHQLIGDVHTAEAQKVLGKAKAQQLRPLCLCQRPGVAMYIAAAGDELIIKRMPGTAATHHHRCRSWLPPDELSGYGAVAEQSIVDNPADGTTALRLGFSLSKSGNRAAPEPSDTPSETVEASGNKLSLRAVLHYLWDEAELTTWHPGFTGHRPWAVVYRRLLAAVDGKVVRKNPLGAALYVPEPFSAARKAEIEQRRIKTWAPARRQPGKATKLLIGVGEVKEIEGASHGFKMQIRHLPGHPWFLEEDLHRKLTKRFADELEHWRMADDGEVKLVAIATFSVSRAGYATVEQMSLMTTDRNWLPFSGDADRTLVSTAVDAGRSIRKVLAYNGSRNAMASLIFTDTTPAVAAFIDRSAADSDETSIAGLPVWNWRTLEDMPPLPAKAHRHLESEDGDHEAAAADQAERIIEPAAEL